MLVMDTEEIWDFLSDCDYRYMCSTKGRFKSLWMGLKDGKRKHREKILSNVLESNGYYQVRLSLGGVSKSHLTHRIIASVFITNEENKKYVNHINGIKTDNRVLNLEWCTFSENVKHAFRIGIQCNKGENHPQSILTDSLVNEIRAKYIPKIYSTSKLAKEYSISKTNIKDIINRKIWRHI